MLFNGMCLLMNFSTDVEDWVLKCVTSENDVMAMEGEGSDTEVNEVGVSIVN